MIKEFWNKLSNRSKKIIKTFFEAGLAYIATHITTTALNLDKEGIKLLIISFVGAGLAAVFNINDKGD